MFLMQLMQNNRVQNIGLFETIENARHFASKIPGYHIELVKEDEMNIVVETISLEQLKPLQYIEYNTNLIPISQFSFESDIDVYYIELINLEIPSNQIIEGTTLVDAYAIENSDLEDYISRREHNYNLVLNYLNEKNIEVARCGFDSEDGEYINIKKVNEDWLFLMHLDPLFAYDEAIIHTIEDLL